MKSIIKRLRASKDVQVLRYILTIFVISRVFLVMVGVSSRIYFEPVYAKWHEWHFSDNVFLDIWGVWDTGWYMDIAQNGYSLELQSDFPKKACCGQNNLGFFPLYPILIKGLSFFIKDIFLSGIIISNISLILSAFLLYKLVRLKNDEQLAVRSVRYLFLFPTGFVLSGVFSESLFLMLLILTFYFAEKRRFGASAISGFFMAATRFVGVFVLVPILYEYLKAKQFRFKNLRIDIFSYLFIVLPGFIFALFSLLRFGDFFAYYHAKGFTWGVGDTNPFNALWGFLTSGDPSLVIIATFFISVAGALFYYRKRIPASYFLLSLIFIGVPLLSDYDSFYSLPRYSLAAFPLFLILALASDTKTREGIISVFLLIIQTFFMAAWVNGALIK